MHLIFSFSFPSLYPLLITVNYCVCSACTDINLSRHQVFCCFPRQEEELAGCMCVGAVCAGEEVRLWRYIANESSPAVCGAHFKWNLPITCIWIIYSLLPLKTYFPRYCQLSVSRASPRLHSLAPRFQNKSIKKQPQQSLWCIYCMKLLWKSSSNVLYLYMYFTHCQVKGVFNLQHAL